MSARPWVMTRSTATWLLLVVLLFSVFLLVPTARAAHCGSGQFFVSGNFIDKTSGKPIPVVATVTFTQLSSDQSQVVGKTTTQLPTSTYQICLPARGDRYYVRFHAEGYVNGQNPDFDVLIDPVPAAGSHVVANESQARIVDLYQSELFFHREDGLFRVYDPRTDGSLPKPTIAGANWPLTGNWQFSAHQSFCGGTRFPVFAYGSGGTMYMISDLIAFHESGFDSKYLDPVGEEPGWDIATSYNRSNDVLLYRTDGAFQVKRFERDNDCSESVVNEPILSGNWTPGWTSIVQIDLNGDQRDEVLFYRKTDGLFRYYYVRDSGSISSPILAGDGYTTGWDSITAVDLDGDRQDEIFFYREDGLFRFYDIRPDGTLPRPMLAGDGYTKGWSSIARFESCRVHGDWECPFAG